MKKLTVWCIVLSFLFCISFLVACDRPNQTSAQSTAEKPTVSTTVPQTTMPVVTTTAIVTTTTPQTTTEPEPVYDLYPEQLVGMKEETDGTTVTFAYLEAISGGGTYTADSIWVDPEAGEKSRLDSAIVKRNQKIYEDLGITINVMTDEAMSVAGMYDMTKQYFAAQDPTIDVYCGNQYYDISFVMQKHLCRVDEIKNQDGEAVLDLSRSYWSKTYNDMISYNSEVYWVTGDLTLRYSGGMFGTFVNTDLYDAYVKQHYQGQSPFDIAKGKNWTLGTMLQMAELVGDQNTGFVYDGGETWDGLALASLRNPIRKQRFETGMDSISYQAPYDTNSRVLMDLFTSLRGSSHSVEVKSEPAIAYFAKGQTLFCVSTLNRAAEALGNTNIHFTVLPAPKMTDSQETYRTGISRDLTLFGISKYSDCKVAAAATLEMMAYCAEVFTTDTYYRSELLRSQTKDQDQTLEMIGMMRDHIHADFTYLYNLDMKGLSSLARDSINGSSYMTKIVLQKTKFEQAFQALKAALEELYQADS